MDALIFNSGFGSRIAELIKDSHKSLLDIHGETILARQLRILAQFNIERVIITTGPNAEKLHYEVQNKDYPFEIVFVHNSKYAETNYIYSMFLASDYLKNEILILHGDLVFNSNAIHKLIKEDSDCVLIDENLEAYKKDFKARIFEEKIIEISTELVDYDYGLQPIYKLNKTTLLQWKQKVQEYVYENKVKVYAENALNELLVNQVTLNGVSIADDYCKEIDDQDDYKMVLEEINSFDYQQEIISNSFEKILETKLTKNHKVLVITFSSIQNIVSQKLSFIENKKLFIYDKANPDKEDIIEQLALINNSNPKYVISIGGGSVIDFTKCLIDFSRKLPEHIAIPTTCGTGSESTKFAVYYFDGIKQSLNKNSLLPNTAILDSSLLVSLPKKALISSVLDAFAQSIESFWSKKSTAQSRKYSVEAIKQIYPILNDGIDISIGKLEKLQYASNLAGRAINITTTTAPHALSYNLTKMFGIPHGIAVNMTLPFIWQIHSSKINDFDNIMMDILNTTHCSKNEELISQIISLQEKYGVWENLNFTDNDLDYLVENVNLERLGNNPYDLNKDEIRNIYFKALTKSTK